MNFMQLGYKLLSSLYPPSPLILHVIPPGEKKKKKTKKLAVRHTQKTSKALFCQLDSHGQVTQVEMERMQTSVGLARSYWWCMMQDLEEVRGCLNSYMCAFFILSFLRKPESEWTFVGTEMKILKYIVYCQGPVETM